MNFLEVLKEKLCLETVVSLIKEHEDSLSIFTSTRGDDFSSLVDWNNSIFETESHKIYHMLNNICLDIRKQLSTLKNIALYLRFGSIPTDEKYLIVAVTSACDVDAFQATQWCSQQITEKLPILLSHDLQIQDITTQDMVCVPVGIDELNRRIGKFISKTSSQSDLLNIVNLNYYREVRDLHPNTCARARPVITSRKYLHGYSMLHKLEMQELRTPLTKEDMDVDMSTHIPKRDFYGRLKEAENRLMNMEALSPLHAGYYDATTYFQLGSYKHREVSLELIDDTIAEIELRKAKLPRIGQI